jgi:solute carrier family 38 (sodium-coupled neutral amino acid transporter), member 4
MTILTSVGVGFVFFCYVIVAIFGYMIVADNQLMKNGEDNILLLLENDIFVLASRLGIIIVVMFSYPFGVVIVRTSFFSILKLEQDNIENIPWVVFHTMIAVFSGVLGILIPNFSLVTGLVVTLAGTTVVFLLPGIFYIKVVEKFHLKCLAFVTTFISFCLGISSFISSLMSIK